ncbi:hypothetical protein AB2L28_04550 [Kineococcus sp. TBRC 1896]|uniref:Uncharacterized protein n=1 Tax=Kineococcus mangrovi TaxID=1660183 RepID=A0ABV4I2J6_9ACTN
MSDASGHRQRTDDDAGWDGAADERVAPLRSAALGGLAVGVLLLVSAAAWLQHAQNSADGSVWGPLVCLLLAFGALSWAGLSALAFWVCRAVLGR